MSQKSFMEVVKAKGARGGRVGGSSRPTGLGVASDPPRGSDRPPKASEQGRPSCEKEPNPNSEKAMGKRPVEPKKKRARANVGENVPIQPAGTPFLEYGQALAEMNFPPDFSYWDSLSQGFTKEDKPHRGWQVTKAIQSKASHEQLNELTYLEGAQLLADLQMKSASVNHWLYTQHRHATKDYESKYDALEAEHANLKTNWERQVEVIRSTREERDVLQAKCESQDTLMLRMNEEHKKEIGKARVLGAKDFVMKSPVFTSILSSKITDNFVDGYNHCLSHMEALNIVHQPEDFKVYLGPQLEDGFDPRDPLVLEDRRATEGDEFESLLSLPMTPFERELSKTTQDGLPYGDHEVAVGPSEIPRFRDDPGLLEELEEASGMRPEGSRSTSRPTSSRKGSSR